MRSVLVDVVESSSSSESRASPAAIRDSVPTASSGTDGSTDGSAASTSRSSGAKETMISAYTASTYAGVTSSGTTVTSGPGAGVALRVRSAVGAVAAPLGVGGSVGPVADGAADGNSSVGPFSTASSPQPPSTTVTTTSSAAA